MEESFVLIGMHRQMQVWRHEIKTQPAADSVLVKCNERKVCNFACWWWAHWGSQSWNTLQPIVNNAITWQAGKVDNKLRREVSEGNRRVEGHVKARIFVGGRIPGQIKAMTTCYKTFRAWGLQWSWLWSKCGSIEGKTKGKVIASAKIFDEWQSSNWFNRTCVMALLTICDFPVGEDMFQLSYLQNTVLR